MQYARRLTVKYVRGFSLLELLIYIAILSVVIAALSSTYVSLLKSSAKTENRNEVQTNARFALENIFSDVRRATSLITPSSVGSASSTLEITVSGETVRYRVLAGQLMRRTGVSAEETVIATTTRVSSFLATRIENYNSVLAATTTGVRITFIASASSTAPDRMFSTQMQGTEMLR